VSLRGFGLGFSDGHGLGHSNGYGRFFNRKCAPFPCHPERGSSITESNCHHKPSKKMSDEVRFPTRRSFFDSLRSLRMTSHGFFQETEPWTHSSNTTSGVGNLYHD
jgi:hypothetical protein